MCYIPPPVDALVISGRDSSKVVAMSVERDYIMWEVQLEKGGIYHEKKEDVLDRVGLLYHPEHNVLFVANGF